MNFLETLRIALNAIKTNKMRAALTILGVVIGVTSVILLVSIVLGLGKIIRTELNSFGANLLIVFPGQRSGARGPGGVVTNKMEFRFSTLIKDKVEDVKYVVPVVQGVGIGKYKNKQTANTTIYGVPGDYFKVLNISVVSGRPFSQNEDTNVAVIGKSVKDELFERTDAIGKEIVLKGRRFQIIGIQEERGSIFGIDQDNVAIIPLGRARSLLGADRPNWFFIKVDENKDIDTAKKKVENVLLSELESDEFTVSTQQDTLSLVGTILGFLSAGLGGVSAISLLVGGIGIMNIMLVSVTERTREIGLRKALGATRRDILLQFLTEAVVLSITGGLVGVVSGTLLAIFIDRFLTTDLNLWYTLLAFGFSVIVGITFGIAPAIKASKLSPIEALRYE